MLVVGHSFGGAVAMHLAAARPDQVAALLLLDPAIGLDGAWMSEIADAMFSSPDYPDAPRPARRRQRARGPTWTPAVLDAELDEHLIELPNGRYGWRVSMPAMMSYWSELARDVVLPPAGTPTTLVRAEVDRAAVCHRRADRRGCSSDWEPTSSCWISTAITWCARPSPSKSPR